MQNWKTNVLDALIILAFIGFFTGVGHSIYSLVVPKPEPIPEPSPCERIEGNVIVENQAGEYRYEVYTTSTGVEVYKCNK